MRLSKIRNRFNSEENQEGYTEQENLFISTVLVIFVGGIVFHSLFLPEIPLILHENLQKRSLLYRTFVDIYPVIVDHSTYSPPEVIQVPVYSFITSGGKGGITSEKGFHTLTQSDTLFISYNSEGIKTNTKEKTHTIKNQQKKEESPLDKGKSELVISRTNSNSEESYKKNQRLNKEEKDLPNQIPANYRFRNDFSLRWDNSPDFSIASVELKGYKYFRDMLRQIRENFAPPGLNLVWRDNAGVVISQPIKPQVVKVLFLLDYEGTVRDARVVSSMGQKPVDDACIRVLLNQNFGPPPREILENGNIFGINFVFPPVY